MVRVPLPFRGVAVLLLAASTVVGQTPEPPAELLSVDAFGSNTPPDFLRELSADTRHPLLSLMVDGEVAMVDAAPAQDSSKPKLTQKTPATPDKKEPAASAPLAGTPVDGCTDGCLLDGGAVDNLCPTMPNDLPFACAPSSCCCTKCKHKWGHKNCGGCGYGCGCDNAYLNWPGCDGCCSRRCGHKHGCGCAYGGGWDTWSGNGGWDGGCGCGGCFVHCEPLCCYRKCHKHSHNRCCGCAGYGCSSGGYWDGGCCMPPQQCCSRKCHHKHGCSSSCGYGGCGYTGWGGCGMASVYAAYNVPCCEPCCKHHWFGRCHKHHGCQQPYPCCSYPMPCMGCDGFGMGGGGYGMGGDGYGMGGDGYGMSGDGFVSDGSFGDGIGMAPMLGGTIN